MAGASPNPRKTYQLSDFLLDNRNNELSHKEALDAALAQHDRVREAAIRVIKRHEHEMYQKLLRQQEQELLEKKRLEEERLSQEKKIRDEQENLRALKAQSIPPLPPQPAQEQVQAQKPVLNGTEAATQNATQPTTPSTLFGTNDTAAPAANGLKNAGADASKPSANLNGVSSSPQPATSLFGKASPAAPNPFVKPAISPFAGQATSPFVKLVSTDVAAGPLAKPVPAQNGFVAAAGAQHGSDIYIQIHKNLKKLRADMVEQAKTNLQLKKRMGDMRREIRKNMGQLTTGKGANKQQLDRIKSVLIEAITRQMPSTLVDPSDYVIGLREPVNGAEHNEPELPSLFIYLINQFSKATINQFINECAASPKNADPVGVIAAQIFSTKEFQWRGKSMIDILMAKFRIVCPVVFGFRGSEKTEQGRARLGWKKQNDAWVPEQQHMDRMMGLGAGYASIALRDFSKTNATNPWPPSHYWTSIANIVNTPPEEITNTQCVVLRAMIHHSEARFINFYGTAAIAALRKALVEFPEKAVIKAPGVSGLKVLVDIYRRDEGLDLR